MFPLGRYCCKSPKLPGVNFPAVKKSDRRPPIDVASITLPGSPASFSSDDEVPHIFTWKSSVQPKEILIASAKRLLQQNLPIAALSRSSKRRRLFNHLVRDGESHLGDLWVPACSRLMSAFAVSKSPGMSKRDRLRPRCHFLLRYRGYSQYARDRVQCGPVLRLLGRLERLPIRCPIGFEPLAGIELEDLDLVGERVLQQIRDVDLAVIGVLRSGNRLHGEWNDTRIFDVGGTPMELRRLAPPGSCAGRGYVPDSQALKREPDVFRRGSSRESVRQIIARLSARNLGKSGRDLMSRRNAGHRIQDSQRVRFPDFERIT